jgi:hypothetical protein
MGGWEDLACGEEREIRTWKTKNGKPEGEIQEPIGRSAFPGNQEKSAGLKTGHYTRAASNIRLHEAANSKGD